MTSKKRNKQERKQNFRKLLDTFGIWERVFYKKNVWRKRSQFWIALTHLHIVQQSEIDISNYNYRYNRKFYKKALPLQYTTTEKSKRGSL